MTPKQLRRKIALLPNHAPITEAFDATLGHLGQHHQNAWWSNHKEHWLGWLKDHNGPTAEFVYNHINCPPMLTWLAEASGVRTASVHAAVEAALAAQRSWNSKCGAIRRLIAWGEIANQLI